MKELFVTYETAYLAKQFGFDEECLCAYRNTDEERYLMALSKWKNFSTHDTHEGFCAAPVYEQLSTWFEKKGIDISVHRYQAGHCDYTIYEIDYNRKHNSKGQFSSKKEAYNKAFSYGFEILKTRKFPKRSDLIARGIDIKLHKEVLSNVHTWEICLFNEDMKTVAKANDFTVIEDIKQAITIAETMGFVFRGGENFFPVIEGVIESFDGNLFLLND